MTRYLVKLSKEVELEAESPAAAAELARRQEGLSAKVYRVTELEQRPAQSWAVTRRERQQ